MSCGLASRTRPSVRFLSCQWLLTTKPDRGTPGNVKLLLPPRQSRGFPLDFSQVDGASEDSISHIQAFVRIDGTKNIIFATDSLQDNGLRFSRAGRPWEGRWNSKLGFISALAVDSSSQWFVAGDVGGRIAVLNSTALGDPNPMYHIDTGDPVNSLATCGQSIIVGHSNGSVTVWDKEYQRCSLELKGHRRRSVLARC